MRYEEEPLGCFQTLSYRLLGLGLYASSSLFSCFVLGGFTMPSGPNWAALAFSFLCAGPIMLGMYILYLRDMRVIQVKDRAVPINQHPQKRKKA